MTPLIRVLHADGQWVVREGMRMMLDLLPGVEVVGVASDGEEAIALAGRLRPDVLLMDLRMPGCDGVEAARRLRQHHPGIKVVVLTADADEASIVDALRAGVWGYLSKDCGAAEMRHTLEQVVEGQVMIDPAVEHHLVDAVAVEAATRPGCIPDYLTLREVEILSLVAEGLTNIAIAGRLIISEATVEGHVDHIMRKIGAYGRAQAVSYAHRHGLAVGVTRRHEE
jgi:DNA-binding NarL/FixJ family response regulator